MKVFCSREEIGEIPYTAVALGNFDGVHRGHAELIARTVRYARERGLKSAVFTFSNHPKNVIVGRHVVKHIASPEEKTEIIRSLGVDFLFAPAFDETFHSMPPEVFVRDLLIGDFNAKAVSCGFNHHFGKDASGNAVSLEEAAEREGFHIEVMEPFIVDGVLVSSTLVRRLISEGKVDRCAKYMGRRFMMRGEVIRGKMLGRTLGFPTANIAPDARLIIPGYGVYATLAEVDGKSFGSVTNIGVRPTVNGDRELSETHIFDFNEVIYGKNIKIFFLEKLRDERKFSDTAALAAQIAKDKEAARERVRDLTAADQG
ncbi:MAG: bifunctional riboflavin kinase/FAD synthetase [Clostridiales Family XIII bacterium]|jgi:riboflavin kinase/FMN adenylyltransferase|nr:bifunctional riboflavin kinase/FAD synthetase [Clostridiales Family XIII bacterium]